jgi:hypothetical protein
MLERFEQLVKVLPKDEVVEKVIFIELDSVRYEAFKNELEDKINTIVNEAHVEDIGKALQLQFMDYKFIVTQNKKAKTASDSLYVAFKILVDGGVQDSSST